MAENLDSKRERAERVRKLRTALGLSLAEFAKIAGVTRSVAWRWENTNTPKHQKPQLHHLGRFEARYRGATNYIYYGDPSQLPFWLAERIMKPGEHSGDGA